jgi:hypothetical protein
MSVNPYESPRDEYTRPRTWYLIPAAERAKIILESLQQFHHPEHEYRVVDADQYSRLSRRFYRRTQANFEALGFRVVGDIEDVTIKAASPDLRTFIRTMVDRSETTVAGFYHVKPHCLWRIGMLLLCFPSKFMELESHSADGRSHCTTTMLWNTLVPHPDAISHDCAPRCLSAADLYERHLLTVSTQLKGDVLMRIRDNEDVINLAKSQQRRLYAHLEEIGWATPDYLLEQGVPREMLDEVYDEMQRILRVAQPVDESDCSHAGGDSADDEQP